MITIDVIEHLETDQNTVFDILTDHGGYTRFDGVKDSELTVPGVDDPRGVGAQRRITMDNGMSLWEDITEFVPGESFAYQITKLRPPVFRHHGGRVDLITENDKTVARWRSTIVVPVPLIGRAIENAFNKLFSAAFRGALRSIDAAATVPRGRVRAS